MNNFKIKYQGQLTFWVHKDQTNPKEMLNKWTYIIYKTKRGLNWGYEIVKGRWEYEPNTKEIVLSWSPLKLKTIKIKNPKIYFFHTTQSFYPIDKKEMCFERANKKIKELSDNVTSSSSSDKSNNKANS